MNAAVEAINQVVAANVKIVFGATIDDTLENQVRITVIATGVKYLGRYQRLKRLLAAGKWEEADNETANLIFQFIIEMICSGDGDIPIFLKLASGNQADSSCFGKIAVEYQKQLEVNSLIVADAALYTESNLKMMSELQWLCRVPLTIKAAKSLISTIPESELIDSTIPGYKLASKIQNYAGIEQRWLVVQSQERKESDLHKLTQKITKAESKAVQDLKKLSQERFACVADAIKPGFFTKK